MAKPDKNSKAQKWLDKAKGAKEVLEGFPQAWVTPNVYAAITPTGNLRIITRENNNTVGDIEISLDAAGLLYKFILDNLINPEAEQV